MTDVRSDQLAEIKSILEQYVPGCEVPAFGFRVTGMTKPWSDLDLAVIGPESLGFQKIGRLIEAFQESTLPFRVDVLDRHNVSSSFHQIIAQHYAVIQTGKPAGAIQ